MREAKVERTTSEVSISVKISLDGRGKTDVETGSNFLNHLLVTLAKHALFDLEIRAGGDLKHHVCEDVALTLGKAFNQAIGERKGIKRFGFAYVPMDDSLARAVVDLCGRPYTKLNLQLNQAQIEDLKTEDIEHFFASFVQTSESNVHLEVLYGKNDHHKVEAAIKALATALKEAVSYEPRRKGEVPSAKGVL